MLKICAIFLIFTSTAMAATSAIVWTENGTVQRVSQADINLAKKPILGYVYDLRLKENLCYEGNDFEVVRILTSGLQRRGTEICDGNLSIQDEDIHLGPCAMPDVHDEEYSLVLHNCK